jgi:glucose-1-phosphate cytidylyltransferase|tara:strand:- start:5473 stop:6240 length:768 start_codon:yes stop_codon:yes gene_type:complete
MFCVIFAGGFGTRIASESIYKPKPMIEILSKPILLRIMDFYVSHGFNKFIVSTGYKHKYIINYFKKLKSKNIFLDFKGKKNFDNNILNSFEKSKNKNKIYVKICNTGLKAETGGRIFYLKNLLKNEKLFFATYGDGLSDVNLKDLLKSHIKKDPVVTVTSVRQPSRFGQIILKKNSGYVKEFNEKPIEDSWINGGFFVISNKIFKFLKKNENFEKETLKKISKYKNKLFAYKHKGFWQCVDTLRDKKIIENLLRK